ncbi:C-type lectin domain family 4 member E-like isoform X1 [Xiphophorus couchianus]|uniref:C-type lectin domain family 4 member E-like isoform X1 n=1 Tax=Xiphophorus couchianus TaxID=32473 RepID=UPI0010164D23|nr:C-type lectin domain family 4 member E-like isoform X1 [Xiphophorus couchianus]
MMMMMSVAVNQEEGDEEAAARGENPSRTCKLPAGGVVLLVLVGLLAAAVITYKLSFDKIRTNQTIQTLKEENEALRKNISEQQTCPTSPTCPPPPAVKNERCVKKRPEWEKYRGSLYYFSTNKSSWNDSRCSCADLGSDLVKIDSREEQMFLEIRVRDLMENDREKFWIGLTDSVEEGKWFWVDGSPLNKSLSFWLPWEPDDMKAENPAGEDCGGMGKKGGADDLICWYDQFCDIHRRSICEKPTNLSTTELHFFSKPDYYHPI